MKHQKWWYGILFLLILLTCVSCGAKDTPEEEEPPEDPVIEEPTVEAEATTMSLRKAMGSVRIQDSSKKEVPLLENMGLYSGYCLETRPVSYAWIDLDSVKLAKMDENSEIEIQKEGKALELLLHAGSLFFHVAEPLGEDESMNIRTSSMIVGIRGTCGWVEEKRVYILEGSVEVTASGETAQVSAGEMAEVSVNEDGETEITVLPYAEEYVAPFVLSELEEDAGLSAAVLEASGLDVLDPPDPVERLKAEYQDIIAAQPLNVPHLVEGLARVYYVDMDGDGSNEMVLLYKSAETYMGEEDTVGLYSSLVVYGNSMGHAVKYGEVGFDVSDPDTQFNIAEFGEKANGTYIGFYFSYYDDLGDLLFYGIEDGSLRLADYFSSGTIPLDPNIGYDTFDWEALGYVRDWENYPENMCPEIPAVHQQLSAQIEELYNEEFYFSDGLSPRITMLSDLNGDGVQDWFTLTEYKKYTSNSEWVAGYRMTEHVWNGTEVERQEHTIDTEQDRMLSQPYDAKICREKATGNLYLSYTGDMSGGGSYTIFFVNLSDWSKSEYYFPAPNYGAFGVYWGVDDTSYIEELMAKNEEENEATHAEIERRFELIQEIGQGTDQSAVDEAIRQIKKEYLQILGLSGNIQ